MKFWAHSDPQRISVGEDLLVLPCFEHDFTGNFFQTESLVELNNLSARSLANYASCEKFAGKQGQVLVYFLSNSLIRARKIVLVGVGKTTDVSMKSLQSTLKQMFRTIKEERAQKVTLDLRPLISQGMDPFAVGKMISVSGHLLLHVGVNYKTRNAPASNKLKKLRVLVDVPHQATVLQGLREGDFIGRSVTFARDLTAMPANILTPSELKRYAQQVEAESEGAITGKYYCKHKLAEMKAGAILAVNQGSIKEPWMSELTYTPEGGPTPIKLFFVGKSVCFDTGGLNLKPASGMRYMKRDMAGGATALGIIKAVASLKLPISVTVILPAVENMPDGDSMRPGDRIETMSGLTVEVDNTDAEGRLTLADAITWARKQGATHIVDFATLTGAVKSIGGDVAAGLFSNNATFGQLVADTANAQDEPVELITMHPELRDLNSSEIADLSNSGGELAGSTTAAWFIREFAGEDTPWVHFDIAGVAYRNRALKLDPRGATGYGVRTGIALAQILAQRQTLSASV